MVSFRRHKDAEGWRYSLSYRTRSEESHGVSGLTWPVERWNGEDWVPVGSGSSYADARQIATEHQDGVTV